MPIGDHLADDDPLRDAFDWEAAYKAVLASGVDIVNASYGFPGTIVEDYTAEQLRTVDRLGPPLQVVAQRSVANPAIFVWLAGNSHGDECDEGDPHCVADSNSSTGFSFNATSPGPEGGAVAKLPELRGHNVVVVAVNETGAIADFSNRCGIAGPWCIAAPGSGITGAYFGPLVPSPGTFLVSENLTGTSVAAPMVSGGLALMKHCFRNQLSNKGHTTSWIGYKLHVDTADGGIPISCIMTSASTHDSQVAIPLGTLTAGRVENLYDLMDAAYDSIEIWAHCILLGHKPIIDVNPRRSVEMQEALRREKKARRTLGLFFPEERRYVERSGSERINGRLKDEFGGRHVRVRGYDKVLAHLMFGMTVLTASQLMRLIVPPI